MVKGSPEINFPLLNLPRSVKMLIAGIVDATLCLLTVWLAYYLRLGVFVELSEQALLAVIFSISIALPIFFLCGLYKAIFRYSGWPTLCPSSKQFCFMVCYMFWSSRSWACRVCHEQLALSNRFYCSCLWVPQELWRAYGSVDIIASLQEKAGKRYSSMVRGLLEDS